MLQNKYKKNSSLFSTKLTNCYCWIILIKSRERMKQFLNKQDFFLFAFFLFCFMPLSFLSLFHSFSLSFSLSYVYKHTRTQSGISGIDVQLLRLHLSTLFHFLSTLLRLHSYITTLHQLAVPGHVHVYFTALFIACSSCQYTFSLS